MGGKGAGISAQGGNKRKKKGRRRTSKRGDRDEEGGVFKLLVVTSQRPAAQSGADSYFSSFWVLFSLPHRRHHPA